MRTTLTLDDDVITKLKSLVRTKNKPFKQIVNETLRRGIEETSTKAKSRPYRTIPHSFGFQKKSRYEKVSKLMEEWDVENYLTHQQQGKHDSR